MHVSTGSGEKFSGGDFFCAIKRGNSMKLRDLVLQLCIETSAKASKFLGGLLHTLRAFMGNI
jgi:hypothetical protein